MDEHLESNRALWDEWAEINARSGSYDLEGFKRSGVRLRDYEIEEVGSVAGKTLLHLQCHFGIDSLSWARLGANVTGIDFSERAIELATGVAAELGIDASFIRSNLYDLPHLADAEFDIVYTSRGVLCWLPRIRPWADVVARFVKPGGFFYIMETHPILEAYEDDFTLKFPYWEREEPSSFDIQGSYADPAAKDED
jgi:ubiquinone/menaquinone biosynthesis C-methylase UbiE